MNLVLNILLVFCIGVSYSSAGSLGSDVAHTEQLHAKEGVQVPLVHNKVQTTITANNSQPVTSKIPTNASSSVKDEPVTEETKTKSPIIIDNKTSTSIVTPKMQNTTSINDTTTPAPTSKITTTERSTTTTTTTTTTTSTTTAAPVLSIADNAASTPAQERQFDGPSFIGGIVLTVGVTAIGFIAFKFYKSGKIQSYRTL